MENVPRRLQSSIGIWWIAPGDWSGSRLPCRATAYAEESAACAVGVDDPKDFIAGTRLRQSDITADGLMQAYPATVKAGAPFMRYLCGAIGVGF